MDTDSLYFAIDGNELEDILKPEMKEQYFSERWMWLPSQHCDKCHADYVQHKTFGRKWEQKPCCATREKLDKRTPGLFKQEFYGDAIIALCPKTYICVGDAGNKRAHKGVSPKNNLCFEHYQKVLAECLQMGVCNKGIRSWKNNLMSYNQYKVGLTPVYIKRQVNNDGVSTEPLKL